MAEKTTADSTRDRLVTAAEGLLLAAGYDSVSVRAVCAAAGVNPAAVHYHFGSKDALVAAMLEDRLAPVWRELLDDVERRRRAGWVPAVADLVDAVLDPLAGLAADPVGSLRLHLLARLLFSGRRMPWSSPWFSLDPWVELVRAARPDLTAEQAASRWTLAFQLVLHVFGTPAAPAPRSPGIPLPAVRSFVLAGLDAP
ncbi:TetR/AcrR family transcriptional regulator [Amycolatopsis australiensis]|uniref:DNA-binding transcriptional regulator, AcrR family n=1 Tax=Amycolatopsis australiensis TaxID=546364 RepID=A0A1K1S422_9PSEU|nr:TetR/AcrR family transcriptional regulator [Amycolatopsis australiensis]SFW79070.1 DNA-binding transcriptional regulator, AcrR family [Amycolatopsis australiensis]